MGLIILTFLVVTGVTFLAAYLVMQRSGVRRDRFAAAVASRDDVSVMRFQDETPSILHRYILRLGELVNPKDAVKSAKVRQRLIWAGYHDPRAVLYFFGAKVALVLVGAFGYTFYGVLLQRALPNVLPMSLMFAAVGFILPDIWLRSRIKERQRLITNALPNVLDMLMVCVEAGMGFDAAVARIAEQKRSERSPLHDELLRMHLETRAGRPREEALRDLGERTGVQEVKVVVGAFIQTDRLGTSLGKTLRVHAEAARVQRRHRAEERAYLAPVKMIFPTVFFLMPSFFLVAMGPSVLMVQKLFQAIGGGFSR
ncbi:MAG TPA: type II secretion system F family protein [Candidatus Tectomicrobia bacterium]|nr:type II secretion system F family protein [Candidatus Tectomicrobia bacterium]